ncbi:MAG: hypothetical protein EOP45_14185 [Sphingobacteriaceae bacterium]|nr:MAG: hypothetical protein EOP45_14185 [Sphingobacteriaceae bacterium]
MSRFDQGREELATIVFDSFTGRKHIQKTHLQHHLSSNTRLHYIPEKHEHGPVPVTINAMDQNANNFVSFIGKYSPPLLYDQKTEMYEELRPEILSANEESRIRPCYKDCSLFQFPYTFWIWRRKTLEVELIYQLDAARIIIDDRSALAYHTVDFFIILLEQELDTELRHILLAGFPNTIIIESNDIFG